MINIKNEREELTKLDAEKLDLMLRKLLKVKKVNESNYASLISTITITELRDRYSTILRQRNLITLKNWRLQPHDQFTIEVNIEQVSEMLKDGGFMQKYKNYQGIKALNEQIEQQKLIKTRNEAKLSSWKLLIFWPMFAFGLFGGLYSFYEIWLKVSTINKEHEENSVNEPNENLDSLKDKIDYPIP